MKSGRAKVLHELGGRPMLGYPLAVAEALAPGAPRGGDRARRGAGARRAFAGRAALRAPGASSAAPATRCSRREPALRGFRGDVLVLYGDTPLLRAETLRAHARHEGARRGADLVMLTSPAPLPGLVVRGPRRARAAHRRGHRRDARGARASRRATPASTCSTPSCSGRPRRSSTTATQQGELYLTDVVERAVREGRRVEALRLDDADECLGVNDRARARARPPPCCAGAPSSALMASGRDASSTRRRPRSTSTSRSGATR